jgi:Protein of unknown function (DUF2384)
MGRERDRTNKRGELIVGLTAGTGAIPNADECSREEFERARVVTAKAALRVLAMWNVEESVQLQVLNAIGNDPAMIVAIHEGRYVDLGEEAFERCEMLLSLFRALIQRRPDHRSFTRAWIHSPNEALGWHSPLHLFSAEGREGFVRVLRMLEAHEKTLAS